MVDLGILDGKLHGILANIEDGVFGTHRHDNDKTILSMNFDFFNALKKLAGNERTLLSYFYFHWSSPLADKYKAYRGPIQCLFRSGTGSPNSLVVSIQSWFASFAFEAADSYVLPCAMQPGSSGSSATYA